MDANCYPLFSDHSIFGSQQDHNRRQEELAQEAKEELTARGATNLESGIGSCEDMLSPISGGGPRSLMTPVTSVASTIVPSGSLDNVLEGGLKEEDDTVYLSRMLQERRALNLITIPAQFVHAYHLIDREIAKTYGKLIGTQTEQQTHEPGQCSADLKSVDPKTEAPVTMVVPRVIETLQKKVFIPLEVFPKCNIVGRLLGPKGTTLKKMEFETGCRIMIRGRGSVRNGGVGLPRRFRLHLKEPLHALFQCRGFEEEAVKRINDAITLVRDLLTPQIKWWVRYRPNEGMGGQERESSIHMTTMSPESGDTNGISGDVSAQSVKEQDQEEGELRDVVKLEDEHLFNPDDLMRMSVAFFRRSVENTIPTHGGGDTFQGVGDNQMAPPLANESNSFISGSGESYRTASEHSIGQELVERAPGPNLDQAEGGSINQGINVAGGTLDRKSALVSAKQETLAKALGELGMHNVMDTVAEASRLSNMKLKAYSTAIDMLKDAPRLKDLYSSK